MHFNGTGPNGTDLRAGWDQAGEDCFRLDILGNPYSLGDSLCSRTRGVICWNACWDTGKLQEMKKNPTIRRVATLKGINIVQEWEVVKSEKAAP